MSPYPERDDPLVTLCVVCGGNLGATLTDDGHRVHPRCDTGTPLALAATAGEAGPVADPTRGTP